MRTISTLMLALLLVTLVPVAADSYAVDPGHTSVVFRLKHNNVSFFYGRFNDVQGNFSFAEGNPAKNSLEINIEAKSIDTNNEKRDNHLRSNDFFNARSFRTISFKSKSWEKNGKGKYLVTGDLTLHGMTKTIKVDMRYTGKGKSHNGQTVMGLACSFHINRKDYGMGYLVGKGLSNRVDIYVGIEGVAK